MNIPTRPLAEVVEEAIHVLVANMGPANTARVINYFSVGYGDYTEERRHLFAGYTVEDIVREIEEQKKIVSSPVLTKLTGSNGGN